jgi:hypothetical protein
MFFLIFLLVDGKIRIGSRIVRKLTDPDAGGPNGSGTLLILISDVI